MTLISKKVVILFAVWLNQKEIDYTNNLRLVIFLSFDITCTNNMRVVVTL